MRFNRPGFCLTTLALGCLLTMTGCAGSGDRTPNVEGRMLHSTETFTGATTASIDGDGSIALISDRGAHCAGPYSQVANDNSGEVRAGASNNGVATLSCNDGRQGSVMFTVGAAQAIGTGMLGQDILTLTIAE